MEFKINPEEEQFKPVTIELTFKALVELQEFQVRMDLYMSDLKQTRDSMVLRSPEMSKCTGSCMSGITKLRVALHRLLRRDSLADDPRF